MKKKRKTVGAQAKEAALVRGIINAGINRAQGEAYEKLILETCGIKGPYQYKKLNECLQDEASRKRFFQVMGKHPEQEKLTNFLVGYLDIVECFNKIEKYVSGKPGEEDREEDIVVDGFDNLDDGVSDNAYQLGEIDVDWDLFNPAKSYSAAELTELVGSDGMDVDTSLEAEGNHHDGELYVIESHVNKLKIKHHHIEAPYVEAPGVAYHELKEDYELAPHLQPMEKVIETLAQKGRAMIVVQSKFTAFTALRYVAEVFSCQGNYCGDVDEDDVFEQAYSLQDKLLVVSAAELSLWAGGVQFQDLNSGVFQRQVAFTTKNHNPPWELFQDTPLALIIDRQDNLSPGFPDQVEALMQTHKPVLVVFVKSDLFAAELNMDNFMNTMTNNRDAIADDISFTLDFDVFEIEEPETSGEYYQAVFRTVASLLGQELGEDLDVPELLTRLRQIRKHRWAGNTTIRQAVSKAVSLKEVDDGVLRLGDFDYLNKSLVNQQKKMAVQVAHGEDAVEAMNRELIGLESVKEQIMTAVTALEMRKQRQAAGLKCAPLHNTFVFQGPPGTGKTEMAKHLTSIMSQKNLINNEDGGITFISGSDLRGEYVGQTGPKIQKIFSENSAVFIDEAYGIVSAQNGSTDSYSQEALAELCIQLERHSTSKLVIFGGYNSEGQDAHSRANMRTFLAENPGINSRISHVVNFPNYEPESLLPILECMAEKNDYTLEEGCVDTALDLFTRRHRSKSFGNGREVRRFFEMAVSHQAARLSKTMVAGKDIGVEDLKTITREDMKAAADTILSAQEGMEEGPARPMGFVQ